ncbi:MAG: DUF3108 domain-containing protein [Gammaproteobacteria bacterium]|nr:DUF3108 domain-containing protein [Gammaproteobacteria bacterium]
MNNVKTYVLTLLTLLLCATASFATENPLKPFRAEYIVQRDGDIIAHTSLSLVAIGENRWRYTSSSEPTGWIATMMGVSVDEQSEWTWVDGLQVLSYRYDRAGKEKHVHLKFDWQQMKVTNIINGDPWHMQIPDATLDKLSINLALMAHLSASETDISFPVADGGKLKTYDFKVIGKESIDTSLGQISTIKVSRNKRGRKDKQAILWLAPDLGYLVVRIEKADKDNDIVTLKIQSLN